MILFFGVIICGVIFLAAAIGILYRIEKQLRGLRSQIVDNFHHFDQNFQSIKDELETQGSTSYQGGTIGDIKLAISDVE